MTKYYRNLAKKSAGELIEIIQDYRDDFNRVLDEQCPSDEKHCGCVPILRTEIANYQNALVLITTFPSSNQQTFAEREMQRVAHDVLNGHCSQKIDAVKYWVEKYDYLQNDYDALQARAEAAEEMAHRLMEWIRYERRVGALAGKWTAPLVDKLEAEYAVFKGGEG